jgi:hypothetical protein
MTASATTVGTMDRASVMSMTSTTTPTRMLEIRTTRYGEMETVQVSEDTVLAFPEGLPGFERHRRFSLIQDPKLAPFSWLQSLHDPLVGFLVIEPGLLIYWVWTTRPRRRCSRSWWCRRTSAR